jgi:hypothetical protein
MSIFPSTPGTYFKQDPTLLVGKHVKSFYGQNIGQVLGISTDIECSPETLIVDCGSNGVKQLPFKQVIVPQGNGSGEQEAVTFVPQWRLESLQLLATKSLLLKRMKALHEIIAEDDSLRGDADGVIQRYEKRIAEIQEQEKSLVQAMDKRVNEIETESKNIKLVMFDAGLRLKSGELEEDSYRQTKLYAGEMMDHLTSEKEEIATIKRKFGELGIARI